VAKIWVKGSTDKEKTRMVKREAGQKGSSQKNLIKGHIQKGIVKKRKKKEERPLGKKV